MSCEVPDVIQFSLVEAKDGLHIYQNAKFEAQKSCLRQDGKWEIEYTSDLLPGRVYVCLADLRDALRDRCPCKRVGARVACNP